MDKFLEKHNIQKLTQKENFKCEWSFNYKINKLCNLKILHKENYRYNAFNSKFYQIFKKGISILHKRFRKRIKDVNTSQFILHG